MLSGYAVGTFCPESDDFSADPKESQENPAASFSDVKIPTA